MPVKKRSLEVEGSWPMSMFSAGKEKQKAKTETKKIVLNIVLCGTWYTIILFSMSVNTVRRLIKTRDGRVPR